MTETEERNLFVQEAMTFVGTPHRDGARLKGVGVDCATYIAEVCIRRGLVPREIEIPLVSPQWHLHRNEELYLKHVREWANDIPDEPLQPGDLAVYKFGRTYSHGAIITKWPRVVHCVKNIGVHEDDASNSAMLINRPVLFFSIWGR